MTSWKPWFARIQSAVSARRSSPGSRARSARVSRAKRFSACSSSSRSAFVIRSDLTAVTRLSSSARTRNASHISCRESVRTRKPRLASKWTSPSADRRRSASRTGVRLTAYCAETCSWRSTVPGASSPETIASSSASAISSALVPASIAGNCTARLPEPLVGGQGEELDELGREGDLGEERLRVLGGVDAGELLAHARGREPAGPHPAPHLRARDLGGGRVLHQVVDRGRADPAQPRVQVARPDGDVRAQARLGDLPARDVEVEQRLRVRDDVLAQPLDLVRTLAENPV